MSQAERIRRHHARIEAINRLEIPVGTGDRLRIDHLGTLLERARLVAEECCAYEATERGLAALDRLLSLAQERISPQSREVAGFIAAIWNGKPLSLSALRAVDGATADDMLAVLDAFRWGRVSLVENVDGGAKRVSKALEKVRQRG